MSEQAVADFFNKVSEDESLQKEVDSIFANNEGTSINQPLADVAVKHGYEITAEDMEQLRLAIKAQNEKSDELNDEELEAVAGGFSVPMPNFTSMGETVNVPISTLAKAATGAAINSFNNWWNS